MAQIFRTSADTVLRLALGAAVALPLLAVLLAMVWVRSGHATGQNRTPVQPVPFSHAHHTAEIGIDCRYCHTGVETSAQAGIPPTQTCMTCHSQLWTEAAMLAPVRDSFVRGERLDWVPVNRLPDYVYFDHSVHLAKGVACTTCHGPVGEMKLMRQHAPLSMGWCLDCHRAPGPYLSPPGALFSALAPRGAEMEAARLLDFYHVSTRGLTECSVCHR
jgi:hypothetical protein